MTVGGATPRGLYLAVVLSVVAHFVAFAGAMAAAKYERSVKRAPQSVLITKLVRLGKQRPEDYLPRLPANPRPAEQAVAIDSKLPVSTKPEVHDKAADAPSARERLKQLSKMSQALKRFSDEEPEGMADGARDGEVSDLAHAVEGNRYATEVYNCLKKNYVIEGVSAAAVRNHSAVVFVRIDRDGRFLESHVQKGSGVAAFDRGVERALRLCGKVSPPPASMREQARDGFEIEFRPD